MAKKDGRNEDEFPKTVYDDGKIHIKVNHCGELFIKDTESDATIRLKSYPHLKGGLQFTTDGRVEPIRVTNMIGWSVVPRS